MDKKNKKGEKSIENLVDPKTGGISLGQIVGDPEDINAVFEEYIVQLSQEPEALRRICQRQDESEAAKKRILSWCDRDVKDKFFLEQLRTHPEFLFFPFGKQKIARWLREKGSENPDVSYRARENLRLVGYALAFVGWEKPSVPPEVVCYYRDSFYKKIKNEAWPRIRKGGEKRNVLKDVFSLEINGEIINEICDDPRIRTPSEIADQLTALVFDIPSHHAVRKIRQEVEVIEVKINK